MRTCLLHLLTAAVLLATLVVAETKVLSVSASALSDSEQNTWLQIEFKEQGSKDTVSCRLDWKDGDDPFSVRGRCKGRGYGVRLVEYGDLDRAVIEITYVKPIFWGWFGHEGYIGNADLTGRMNCIPCDSVRYCESRELAHDPASFGADSSWTYGSPIPIEVTLVATTVDGRAKSPEAQISGSRRRRLVRV